MADIDNLKGGTKRVVEETEPLNNLRGGTKRVVIVGGGSSLPDQTGQSGKFLTTDGTDASWATINALQNTATGTNSYVVGGNGSSNTGNNDVVIGADTVSRSGGNNVYLGKGTNSMSSFGARNVAAGSGATTNGNGNVSVGYLATATNGSAQVSINTTSTQTNSDANTFKVANANGNFEIMSADGTVPTARLTKVNTTATLAVADWSSNTQTVSVTGMTADGVVLVSPTPANQSAYTSAGILCTAQAAGSLTFTCDTVPSADITVTVVML